MVAPKDIGQHWPTNVPGSKHDDLSPVPLRFTLSWLSLSRRNWRCSGPRSKSLDGCGENIRILDACKFRMKRSIAASSYKPVAY